MTIEFLHDWTTRIIIQIFMVFILNFNYLHAQNHFYIKCRDKILDTSSIRFDVMCDYGSNPILLFGRNNYLPKGIYIPR